MCGDILVQWDFKGNSFRYLYLFLHNAQMQNASAISGMIRSAGIKVKVPIATGLSFHPEY